MPEINYEHEYATMRTRLLGVCKAVDTMRRMTLGKNRNGHYEVSVNEYENVITKCGALLAIMLKEDADIAEAEEATRLADTPQEEG